VVAINGKRSIEMMGLFFVFMSPIETKTKLVCI